MDQAKAEKPPIYAYAGDEGFEFILPPIAAEAMYDPAKTSIANSGSIKVVQ